MVSSGCRPRLKNANNLGILSTGVFETRTAIGSELFSLLTCLSTTTCTLLSIVSPLEMISIKIRETPPSWHEKCSLPAAAVRVSKTRVLKFPKRDVTRSRILWVVCLCNNKGYFLSSTILVLTFVLRCMLR